MSYVKLPQPDQIVQRLQACRVEIAALKKLLKLSQAAQDAERARQRRRPPRREGAADASR
jgi:hypothetical protein